MANKIINPMQAAIASRLRQARLRAGYKTQSHFSESHGIKQSTYSMHEKGTRGISTLAAQQYARLLNISVDWLLLGTGDEQEMGVTPHTYPNNQREDDGVTTEKNRLKTKDQKSNKLNLAHHMSGATLGSGSAPLAYSSDSQIPVYGPTKGMGDRIDRNRPIAFIPRPMQLAGIEDVQAFLVTQETITPFLARGDTAVINPAKPLVVGRPALVIDHDQRITIGILTHLTESAIALQPDPAKSPVEWDLASIEGAYHVAMTLTL